MKKKYGKNPAVYCGVGTCIAFLKTNHLESDKNLEIRTSNLQGCRKMKPGKMPHGKNVRYRSDLKDYEAKNMFQVSQFWDLFFIQLKNLKSVLELLKQLCRSS